MTGNTAQMFLLPGLALGNPGPDISQLTEPLPLAA